MGAWIEIILISVFILFCSSSHPTMGAWIEIHDLTLFNELFESHPTMGAWIEITSHLHWILERHVAPHDGCVD